MSLSVDGNTALVGGYGDNDYAGACWVWTRIGDMWTQQGSKLVGLDAAGNASQGISVSLSADGNTALVGGNYDNAGDGAAWVWIRSGGVWIQQGAKLVGSGAASNARQGTSVALSADGNTALVGGPGDGAAWIWTRNGGVWTQQGPKLVGSGAVENAHQGISVSLSADGTTAIVGGNTDDRFAGFMGAAWIWTRSGSVWTQQGPKLVGSGGQGHVFQGTSVSLSADGNTALVGGPGDDSGGAVWVWTRSAGVWSQQGPKLTAPAPNARQGTSVALSADGNLAIVGAPGYISGVDTLGAAWLWRRSSGVWSLHGGKLLGSGAVGNAEQGISVSLSAAGDRAIVGGDLDNSAVGAAWIFTATAPGDFDRDGQSDRTTFRPSTGVWYSALSAGGATATGWGLSSDIDVAADYDGDGKTDVAVWRPSTGTWYILQSSNSAVRAVTWGTCGDMPLAGDVDGDGEDDLVIYRPSTGTWYFLKSGGATSVLPWGISTDQPLIGDYDGDGKADAVAYRASAGAWYISESGGGTSEVGWGTNGDIAIAGDFDGDGVSDATIFRLTTGQWFVLKSTGGVIVVDWGTSEDTPVSGDWDGDGTSDFTVWRASNGVWYTQFASGGTAAVEWGVSGDKPIGRLPGS